MNPASAQLSVLTQSLFSIPTPLCEIMVMYWGVGPSLVFPIKSLQIFLGLDIPSPTRTRNLPTEYCWYTGSEIHCYFERGELVLPDESTKLKSFSFATHDFPFMDSILRDDRKRKRLFKLLPRGFPYIHLMKHPLAEGILFRNPKDFLGHKYYYLPANLLPKTLESADSFALTFTHAGEQFFTTCKNQLVAYSLGYASLTIHRFHQDVKVKRQVISLPRHVLCSLPVPNGVLLFDFDQPDVFLWTDEASHITQWIAPPLNKPTSCPHYAYQYHDGSVYVTMQNGEDEIHIYIRSFPCCDNGSTWRRVDSIRLT